MTENIQLKQKLEQNEIVLQVLPVEDLEREWNRRKGTNQDRDSIYKNIKDVAGKVSAANDTLTVIRICKDLGVNGKYIVKTVGSKQYIVLKGYPGIRSVFTAPRYLSTNPKVVRMAIGQVGVQKTIKAGGMITIVLYAGLEILEFVLQESTLAELVGTLATDLIKVGISTVVAHTLLLGIGSASFCAAGPLVVAIGIGLVIGGGLEYVDKKFKLTDQLVDLIDQYGKKYSKLIGNQLHEMERELTFRAFSFDIDSPLRH